jgi:hypothetical protein
VTIDVKAIEEMSAAELRRAMAHELQTIETLSRMLRERRDAARAIQARLLSGDGVRMLPSEGIPSDYGVLKRHRKVSGRRYVEKEKVDERAGELPENLQPQKDHRIVIEHESTLPTAVAAELIAMAEAHEADPEAPEVKRTEKAKYPTVAQLEKEYGPDSELIGKPATEHLVVLAKDAGEDEILLGIDGMLA